MRKKLLALAPLVLALTLAYAASSCGSGEPEANPARRELVELVLLSPPSATGEAPLFEAPGPSVLDALERIEELRTDEHVVGVFVRIGEMGGAWGRLADVAEGLASIRAAGKPLHCHIEAADNAGYLLAASSCDRLTITPAGMLDTVGVAAQLFYARDLLAQIGVSAQILQVGSFKGAGEPLTRQEPSPQMLESMGALVDDLQAALVRGIAAGRHRTPEEVQAILDAGPYDSAGALAAGLVDGVEFDDEARTHAREACSATRGRSVSLVADRPTTTLAELLGALASGESVEPEPTGRYMVVAHLDGQITDAEEAGVGSGQAGPFVERMREIAEDDDVAALVLRIDSPGGSALASDRMWHAVRRVAGRKPVIVSVGDMAASGGYYVACAGHEIFAHDASIVGSIGVVGGKVDASELLGRLGVSVTTIERGEHAAWTSITEPFTDEERSALLRIMGTTYDRFVRRVATSRSMDEARVRASAEGRVWSGTAGRERGLVDQIGGLRAAMARARDRAGLPEDVEVVEWPSRQSMIASLVEASSGGGDAQALALLRSEGLSPAAELIDVYRLLGGHEHVLAVSPFAIVIR